VVSKDFGRSGSVTLDDVRYPCEAKFVAASALSMSRGAIDEAPAFGRMTQRPTALYIMVRCAVGYFGAIFHSEKIGPEDYNSSASFMFDKGYMVDDTSAKNSKMLWRMNECRPGKWKISEEEILLWTKG